MGDGALIGRDNIHAAGEGGADVGDGGLTSGGLKRGQLHGGVGAGCVQKGLDRFRARAERRVFGEAAMVDGSAVPQRADADYGERKIAALAGNQTRQRPSNVAVTD